MTIIFTQTLNFLQGQGELNGKQIGYALLAQSALIVVRQAIDKLSYVPLSWHCNLLSVTSTECYFSRFHELQVLKNRIKFHFLQKSIEHGMPILPVSPLYPVNSIYFQNWGTSTIEQSIHKVRYSGSACFISHCLSFIRRRGYDVDEPVHSSTLFQRFCARRMVHLRFVVEHNNFHS